MSLLSSLVDGIFANEAADEVSDSARESQDLARYIYDDTEKRNEFRNDLGNAALSRLGADYGLVSPQGNVVGGPSAQYNTATQDANSYANYIQNNPDLASWYNSTARNSPHILNQGYDADGDGTISQAEAGQFHYDNFGREEGRVLGKSQGFSPFSGGEYNNRGTASLPFTNGFNGNQGVPNIPFAGIPNQPTPLAQNNSAATGGNVPTTTPQGGDASQFAGFYASPDYQLSFNEGQKAIENGAAARGGLLSGNTAKAVTQFGQNLAANQYGNYRNTLSSIAGTGQVANQATTAAGQNYANQFENSNAQIGAANANRYNAYGGITNDFMNSAGNFFLGGFG